MDIGFHTNDSEQGDFTDNTDREAYEKYQTCSRILFTDRT